MSCCMPGAEVCFDQRRSPDEEVLLASRTVRDGQRQTDLSVPDIHCGACLQKIETTLRKLDGVVYVRANLSSRRVAVLWSGDSPPPLMSALGAIGYQAHIYDAGAEGADKTLSQLLRALAVAGFATSNIMLLSVSIWSGADIETRDAFHWISAAIALPTLAYSGQVFFRSAWSSLRHGQTNMDVPISIGVLLAFGLSLYETVHHGQHAYFDAAVSLLFFLLIGRTLDHVMRDRARQAVQGLARLSARGALVLKPDGTRIYLPVDEIEPGMLLLLAAGERVPVDGRIIKGRSELDCALVSGESAPRPAAEGAHLQAGILNLTGPLEIVATATAKGSFLAEMTRMMEAAEAGRSTYRRIADRASRLYAPVVHATAFLTFAGWMVSSGDLHRSVTIAIAVLIVTCPCALGLAVPMVHVVAARRLFEKGIMIRDGSALERLANVDTVVFDKTGTLTTSRPRLVGAGNADANALAAAIALHSKHPYSLALLELGDSSTRHTFDSVAELPGFGLEARSGPDLYRLGRPGWAITEPPFDAVGGDVAVALSINGRCKALFRVEDNLRAGAREAISDLEASHFDLSIMSGDNDRRVRDIASRCGVDYVAGAQPADKVRHIGALKTAGRTVLMVGDGLNDAPALIEADVSMAPASAADIGRNAADLVFMRESLAAVPQAIAIARDAGQRVRQNFTLAIGYNVVAIPIAVLGYVTPLLAAVAMSLSSILVVGNALRPGLDRYAGRSAKRPDRAEAATSSPTTGAVA